MADIATLNRQFSLDAALRFTQHASGLTLAEIDNAQARAKVSLQGGQLLCWQPKASAQPAVWSFDLDQLKPGVSPHSGVPVCWPWFGAHPDGHGLPAHGYARTQLWDVVDSGLDEDGATRLGLRLAQPEQPGGPHAAQLELHMVVGDSLHMELVTSNLGAQPFVISEALHTYFYVGDIARARVLGLDGVTYADKVQNYARQLQHGAIAFSGETDRVYLDSPHECAIEDEMLQRRIRIAKHGSRSTVVWTPWRDKGLAIPDIGAGWSRMLCVESANALDNQVTVQPGAVHALTVEYRVEPL